MERTVYIGGVSRKSYHASPNCANLPTYDRETLPETEAVAASIQPCKVCTRTLVRCNAFGCEYSVNGTCRLMDNHWGGAKPQQEPIDGCIEYTPKVRF
jgi:hypothetical protein